MVWVLKNGKRYPFAASFFGCFHLRHWFNGRPEDLHESFEVFKTIPLVHGPVYMSKEDKNGILDAYCFLGFTEKSLLYLLKNQALNIMFFNAPKYGDAIEAYKSFLSIQDHIVRHLPKIRSPDYQRPYYVVSKEEVVLSPIDNPMELDLFKDLQNFAYNKEKDKKCASSEDSKK